MCASFRVFSLNFEGDKLSPWPFFKGTIPIAVRDWRNGAAWLKPCSRTTFYLKGNDEKLWVEVIIVTFLDAVAIVDVLTASNSDVKHVGTQIVPFQVDY